MNTIRAIQLATVVISGLQASTMFAQQRPFRHYKLEPESGLWLEGTATVGDYVCVAGQIEGNAKLHIERVLESDSVAPGPGHSEVCVSILVKSFECGNTAMNEDMYNALKAESFPFIRYELVNGSVSDSTTFSSTRTVNTNGKLSIAGVTRVVPVSIVIRQLSPTRFRITGSKVLSMRDFSITPPIALWGLIEADDQLIVRFDLVAEQE